MRDNFIKKIDFLNEISLKSVKADSEKEILKNFIHAGVKVLGADFGFTWFRNADEADFRLLYKTPNTKYNPLPPRHYGLTSKTFKTKKAQFVYNVMHDRSIRSDAKNYMKSVVFIPICHKQQNFGNIIICFKKNHQFSSEDKTLCSLIGHNTAQAITISKLYNNLKNFNTKLERSVRERTEELEQDHAKDEAILTSLGEGIVAVDKEGKIMLLNPQAEEILGVRKDEALGYGLAEVQPLYEENGNKVKLKDRPTYKSFTKGRKFKSSNYYLAHKNGTRIPVSITSTPIKLNGKLMGVIEVIHDIIKEKEIDKAKSELISMASHQLRTPLSAINWYTEALIKNELGPVNSKQRKYLLEISNANQKMIELVYDFLNVSRIELGTFIVQLSTFNPQEIVKGVLKDLKPNIRKKKLKVEEIYQPGIGEIQADKKIVRLIFQNLITNAVKYTPPKGKISVKTGLVQHSKPRLAIEVKDTGYGIPKQQHDKVFTKLFRGDNIAQLNTEGTGLGLYIVKSFVDLCKGRIRFKSEPGKGTKFYIELPVSKPKNKT